MSPNLNIFCVR